MIFVITEVSTDVADAVEGKSGGVLALANLVHKFTLYSLPACACNNFFTSHFNFDEAAKIINCIISQLLSTALFNILEITDDKAFWGNMKV
jgi:hypothetical protein